MIYKSTFDHVSRRGSLYKPLDDTEDGFSFIIAIVHARVSTNMFHFLVLNLILTLLGSEFESTFAEKQQQGKLFNKS